mmetsp:Transcript_59586/g.158534  ORF Transcript_59586/g.158534 Transcript_59586/m.158534 type:complete len:211 (-) Transcript_59586:2363-2995(-)
MHSSPAPLRKSDDPIVTNVCTTPQFREITQELSVQLQHGRQFLKGIGHDAVTLVRNDGALRLELNLKRLVVQGDPGSLSLDLSKPDLLHLLPLVKVPVVLSKILYFMLQLLDAHLRELQRRFTVLKSVLHVAQVIPVLLLQQSNFEVPGASHTTVRAEIYLVLIRVVGMNAVVPRIAELGRIEVIRVGAPSVVGTDHDPQTILKLLTRLD